MSPDTNYRRLAESDTRNRENLFQTRYADHGGWQSGHMDGEGSTPVVSIPATTPDRTNLPVALFAAETTKAPVVPTYRDFFLCKAS